MGGESISRGYANNSVNLCGVDADNQVPVGWGVPMQTPDATLMVWWSDWTGREEHNENGLNTCDPNEQVHRSMGDGWWSPSAD